MATKSKNGKIDFSAFGGEFSINPESNRDYPSAPYYVTNESKFMRIDGRKAKEIYLCESLEEAQTVFNNLRNELFGRQLANRYTRITTEKPRLNLQRNIYAVRYNNGDNKRYMAI